MPHTDFIEYRLISAFYADREAERSRVPLINHINEGLVVLDAIAATEESKRAFCLHPMVQDDKDLKDNYPLIKDAVSGRVLMLAMEYRSVANDFLREKVMADPIPPIRLSPLFEVNDMLIADKVQNRKDFITYHSLTHPNRAELDKYFKLWLSRLTVGEAMYARLCQLIDESKQK